MNDTHLREEKIDGTTVFEGRIVRLEVDRVRLSNGRESRREVIRHPGAVLLVPITRDGGVILVRQHRYPTGEVLLEVPAAANQPAWLLVKGSRTAQLETVLTTLAASQPSGTTKDR